MPEPDWVESDYDPWEKPDVGSEILGRGLQQRKSKTYLQSWTHATILGFASAHSRMLMEQFRSLHARQNKVPVEVKSKSGETRVEYVPEVLSDMELRSRYPIIAMWERQHQEQVDHAASITGFTVRAVSHYDHKLASSGNGARGGKESSAGTDGSHSSNNNRWR